MYYIALCGELALEEAMDLSQERLRDDDNDNVPTAEEFLCFFRWPHRRLGRPISECHCLHWTVHVRTCARCQCVRSSSYYPAAFCVCFTVRQTPGSGPRSAWVVDQRPLTTEGRHPSRAILCEFCGGQSGKVQDFWGGLRFSPVSTCSSESSCRC